MIKLVEWLQNNMLPCYIKQETGISCPGCGMQRSILELIQGDIAGSIEMYPALLPIVFMFLYYILDVFFKFKYGHKVLLILFIFNSVLVLFSYFLKIDN